MLVMLEKLEKNTSCVGGLDVAHGAVKLVDKR